MIQERKYRAILLIRIIIAAIFIILLYQYGGTVYLGSILWTVFILVTVFQILSIKKVFDWTKRNIPIIQNVDIIVGIFTIASILFAVLTYNNQQYQQNSVAQQNENTYLENSQVDLNLDSSTVSYILSHTEEFKKSSEVIVATFIHPDLDKLVDDINLSQAIRANIIATVADIAADQGWISLLDANTVDRDITWGRLASTTEDLKNHIDFLYRELPFPSK